MVSSQAREGSRISDCETHMGFYNPGRVFEHTRSEITFFVFFSGVLGLLIILISSHSGRWSPFFQYEIHTIFGHILFSEDTYLTNVNYVNNVENRRREKVKYERKNGTSYDWITWVGDENTPETL